MGTHTARRRSARREARANPDPTAAATKGNLTGKNVTAEPSSRLRTRDNNRGKRLPALDQFGDGGERFGNLGSGEGVQEKLEAEVRSPEPK